MCCRLSQLGSGAAPAAGAHLPPTGSCSNSPHLSCLPPLLRHFGDAKDGAELGCRFKRGCAGGTSTVGSGMAHLTWGQRFGSGCDFLQCCLLGNSCWVVLLPPLMNFWALRARMRNCVFRMRFGERVSLLGGCGASSSPSSHQHFSLEVSQNAHNQNLNTV